MSTSDNRTSTKGLVAAELLPGLENFPTLDFSAVSLDDMRAGFMDREEPPMPDGLETVGMEERHIPGAEGAPDVRVLIYTPPGKADGKRPALLHIHGGGYVIGSPEISDIPNRATAMMLDCVVVSVDYRKAPETRWPGSRDDCYAALTWLHGNADSLGVDAERIAIAGESAGGGHAAALAIHARNQGGPKICLQVLDSPMLDDRTGSTSEPHPYTGEFVWTPEANQFGWESLLGVTPGGPDVKEEMAPARTKDMAGLPPTLVYVGALDLFMEEDMEYVRRLARVGVPVELLIIPGAFHGFGAAGLTPQVMATTQMRLAALARAFGVDLPG